MDKPKCVCFQDETGDVILDTAGNEVCSLLVDVIAECHVCPEAQPYVFATWAAGVLITAASVAKQLRGTDPLNPDTSDLERDALALIPHLEGIIKSRLAIIQRQGNTSQ